MTSPPVLARGQLAKSANWNVERASSRTAWTVGKRLFDISLALILVTVTMPLLLLVAMLIKLDSRGPVFYRVRRVGYQGRPLMMLKFRKMYDGATGGPLTAAHDPRLTRVGHVLTRTRLDELPQLWDVVRGRMSIIGPRPEDPRFVAIHLADYEQILTVRPGIVGLAQLAYEAETSIVSDTKPIEDYVERIMPQKLTLDKLYAANTSWRLDFSIVRWAVVALILRRPVAVSRATGAMSVRAPREPGPAPRELARVSVRSSEDKPNVEDRAPQPAGAHAAD